MKKIVILLVVVFAVMTSMSFAATVTTAKVAAAEGKNWSIGTWGGIPTLSYSFNKDMYASVGTNYSSAGSGVWGLFLKGGYNLAASGGIQPSVGLEYQTTSAGAVGSIGLTYGLTVMMLPNLSLGLDFVLADYTNTLGTNVTRVIPGVAITAGYYF